MAKDTSTQFHPLSEEYLQNKDINYRKKMGQYFTPESVRTHLLKQLPKIKAPKILDPSCGSGEFLRSAKEFFPGATLHGWEIDPALVKISKKIEPDALIVKKDSLNAKNEPLFDFVIGNPPYFEFQPDSILKQKYIDVMSGRVNIFSMFIKLGFGLLKPNGYLAYVIPPSMNNGAYFRKLREFIIKEADIKYLELLDSTAIFHNAQQQVMVIVLKKQNNTGKYLFKKNGITIFSPEPKRLKRAFSGKTTLFEAGFSVKTGKIVWNNNREKLSKSSRNSTLLIWSHNIKELKLQLHISEKPQYIKSESYDVGPAIVVNRITGSANNGKLKAAVVGKGVRFLAENHVNVITPKDKNNASMRQLKSIARQISSAETAEIIRLITGNTQLSKTELWKLVPLDL